METTIQITTAPPDARKIDNAVAQHLADEIVMAYERIESLEADVRSYRELSKQSIEFSASQQARIKSLERQLSHLREEVRRLRLSANQSIQVAA